MENWLIWALLSAFFAALTAIFAKLGIAQIDSDYATLIRAVIIVMILTGIVAYSGKWTNPLKLPNHSLLFLILSAFATGASWLCYFRALQLGTASKVAPVDKLSVVLVAILAVLFLHEKPTLREWLGIMMVSGGVILIALKH